MCPLVLSCLILCWLLSLWSSLDLACLVFVFGGLFLSCPVFSSLGPSALWGVLESLLGTSGGTSWGLWEPSGGLLRPWTHSWAAPGPPLGPPGGPWAPIWAALGSSWLLLGLAWAALGRSWGVPEALLAPPGRLLGPSGRLESRVLPKSRISSTVQRFSWFFGGQGGLLAPPGALLEPSWRPLGPSWRLLGRPSCSWVALGWLLAGPSGSRVVLGWPWPWPQWARDRAQRRRLRGPVRIHCID